MSLTLGVVPACVFTDEIQTPAETTADAVRAQYEATLADVIETVGSDAVAAHADIDADTIAALAAGDSPTLTVTEAADILAASDDYPPADTLQAELQDHVMLQMSSAVLDVDALARGLDGDHDAKPLQQKLEGRQPMTLAEYARIHRYVAAQNPY